MKRRAFIAVIGGAAAWPLARAKQPGGRPYHIGILETQSLAMNHANMAAFREGLRELGYVGVEGMRSSVKRLLAKNYRRRAL